MFCHLFHLLSHPNLRETELNIFRCSHLSYSVQALEDLSTQYDLSVRNSVGGVVQFQYGDDTLDPACLEGDAAPVEYVRTWSHAMATYPREGEGLFPWRIRQIAREVTDGEEWSAKCHIAYREATFKFIFEKIVGRMAKLREKLDLYPADEEADEEYGDALNANAERECDIVRFFLILTCPR